MNSYYKYKIIKIIKKLKGYEQTHRELLANDYLKNSYKKLVQNSIAINFKPLCILKHTENEKTNQQWLDLINQDLVKISPKYKIRDKYFGKIYVLDLDKYENNLGKILVNLDKEEAEKKLNQMIMDYKALKDIRNKYQNFMQKFLSLNLKKLLCT